ncbi:MAG: putative excinuclease subunit [Clostridiales bacterium]|nr:putative excinuclease subunit [Clostridiales bacterium]
MSTLIDISDKIKNKLKQFPKLPGIYKMLDSNGNIIYIGKSKCLKIRVKSYFTNSPRWNKVKTMVLFIDDIDFIVTDTHLEARLLECELIKHIKPHFNAQMKNDSKYFYLKIDDYNYFNSLSIVSEREANTYGPFRKMSSISNVIDLLKQIYPIDKTDRSYSFEYHIFPISMEKGIFNQNRCVLFELFDNEKNMKKLIKVLESKMKESATSYKFEVAAKYRDIIQGLNYLSKGIYQYKKFMTKEIVMKIPINQGIKLFFISNGNMLLKKYFDTLSDEDIASFVNEGKQLKSSLNVDLSEKANIDFLDILYSEVKANKV